MKKIVILFAVVACLLFVGCRSTVSGHEGLLETAVKHAPIAGAEQTEIVIAGSIDRGDDMLVWFITGNEYQAHTYLPIEFEILKNDRFRFVRTHKPMEFADDTAVVNWDGKYYFLINNENCKMLSILADGEHKQIEVGKYPFLYTCESIPQQYDFLDRDGNSLT